MQLKTSSRHQRLYISLLLHLVLYGLKATTLIRQLPNENYGDRGGCYPQRQITPSEISITLQMIGKPNSIIV